MMLDQRNRRYQEHQGGPSFEKPAIARRRDEVQTKDQQLTRRKATDDARDDFGGSAKAHDQIA